MQLADALSEAELPPWLTTESCAVCSGRREDLAPPCSPEEFRALAVVFSSDASCASAALAACLEQRACQRSWVDAHRSCAVSCPKRDCRAVVPLLVESSGLWVSRKSARKSIRGQLTDYVRCPECSSQVPVVAHSPSRAFILPRLRGVNWCGVGLSCQGNCPSPLEKKTTCPQ